MIAVAPHLAGAPQRAIDRARDPDDEPSRAARERLLIVRLDDQVEMIALHREVNEAKGRPAGGAESRANLRKYSR